MMRDLRPYAVFAETVAAGSMSAAARRLGMSASAVSQTLRALEAQVGVVLLHRSTRKLTLTEAGARCYPHCVRLLEAAQAASDSLLQARDVPSGELRVAAPVGFAAHIAPALAPLLAQAPQLSLRLLVDDAMIDLIDARIDLAIRIGQLADSTWVARRLCDVDSLMCAAPAYLQRHGGPECPQDLSSHHWCAYRHDAAAHGSPHMTLDLHGTGGERQRIPVPVRYASNNQMAVQQMCEHGLGLARLAYVDIRPALASGALVHVLPQWRYDPLPVSMVTPRRDGEPAKVRLAVQALRRYFAQVPTAIGP